MEITCAGLFAMWMILLGFAAVLSVFLLVGWSPSARNKETAEDYLVASRQFYPWLVGFAAASTNSSGFMFIGLITATVLEALSAMRLMVGWIAGDYLAWLFFHRRLRELVGVERPARAGVLAGGAQSSGVVQYERRGLLLKTPSSIVRSTTHTDR